MGPKTRVAVFATDDSAEATRCLERFVRLAPHGVSKVYVLTLNEIEVGGPRCSSRAFPT